MDAKKGDWVRVHQVILRAGERAGHLPEETKNVPLEMWDKGFLIDEGANLGDRVLVTTIIGREIEGTLVAVTPSFDINYGEMVTETLYIGRQLKELLGGEGL